MGEEAKEIHAGLAGVVAATTAICACGGGEECSLLYRGYPIGELAAASSFEAVAWLLLRGELPTIDQLEGYRARLRQLRALPEPLKKVLEAIPTEAHPMDVLRSGCSFLGHLEPEEALQGQRGDQFFIADRLIALMPSIVLYWWLFCQKGACDLDVEEATAAGYILHLLCGGDIPESHRRALDVALMLYAEHEFNASTFTVRTIASTLADFYSAFCGGLGALKGRLHGGANEWAMAFLERQSDPDSAEREVIAMLVRRELVMGFGHRVYKEGDPRSSIVKVWAERLAIACGKKKLYDIAERVEEVMWREKHLCPNLDFYSAVLFNCLNIPVVLYTPLFALARTTGWAAHLLEQRADNKLIRPLSKYIGPERRSLHARSSAL